MSSSFIRIAWYLYNIPETTFKLLMTKKQGKKKRQQQLEDFTESDVSDSLSQTSHVESDGEDTAEPKKTWQEELVEHVNNLTEKRGKGVRRLTALEAIYSLMSIHYAYDALSSYIDTAMRNLYGALLKATSAEETIMSLKCLCLMAVTFGGSTYNEFIEEDLARKVESTALTIAQQYNNTQSGSDSRTSDVRRKALFTYTIWKFVDESGEDLVAHSTQKPLIVTGENAENMPALSVLQSFWPKVPDADYKNDQNVLAESISCWSLLVTLVPEHLLDKFVLNNAKNVLMKLVLNDHSNFSVKKSAAEALSLLSEISTSFSNERSTLFDDTVEQIRRLSTQTERHAPKKIEKSVQKSHFRDFLATVEEGQPPQLPIVINGVTLNFESWAKIIQFNMLKAILKAGVNTHLMENSFLRQVFGISGVNFTPETTSKARMPSYDKRQNGKGGAYRKEDTKFKNKLTRQFANFLSQEE
jgi:hypothetical protein